MRMIGVQMTEDEYEYVTHAADLRDLDVLEYTRRAINLSLRTDGVDAVLLRESNDEPPAALSSPSVADSPTWQPIETAPRDGTSIIVYTVHGEIEITDWYVIDTSRFEPNDDGVTFRKVSSQIDGWNGNTPTHWMPMPKPPSAPSPSAAAQKETP